MKQLQQQLTPGPPAPYLSLPTPPGGSPPLPISALGESYSYGNFSPPHGSFEKNSPINKAYATVSPASSLFFSTGAFSRGSPSFIGDITDPGFGDLLDLNFEDIADVEPMDWNDNGILSNTDSFEDEGFESQPAEITKCYRSSHAEIVGEALRWSGKQLWEMTDEEFRRFCSQPPPWE